MITILINRNNLLCPSGILITGPLRCGKTSIIKVCSRRLNLQLVECNCYDLCGDSVAAMEARIKNLFQKGTDSTVVLFSLYSQTSIFQTLIIRTFWLSGLFSLVPFFLWILISCHLENSKLQIDQLNPFKRLSVKTAY